MKTSTRREFLTTSALALGALAVPGAVVGSLLPLPVPVPPADLPEKEPDGPPEEPAVDLRLDTSPPVTAVYGEWKTPDGHSRMIPIWQRQDTLRYRQTTEAWAKIWNEVERLGMQPVQSMKPMDKAHYQKFQTEVFLRMPESIYGLTLTPDVPLHALYHELLELQRRDRQFKAVSIPQLLWDPYWSTLTLTIYGFTRL